jgi:hypothetical protein
VFTARYALSPYIKQTRCVFKGLIHVPRLAAEMRKRKDLMIVLRMDVMTCTLPNNGEKMRRFGGGCGKHTEFSHVRVASSRESMLKCIKDRKHGTCLMERLLRPNASVLS